MSILSENDHRFGFRVEFSVFTCEPESLLVLSTDFQPQATICTAAYEWVGPCWLESIPHRHIQIRKEQPKPFTIFPFPTKRGDFVYFRKIKSFGFLFLINSQEKLPSKTTISPQVSTKRSRSTYTSTQPLQARTCTSFDLRTRSLFSNNADQAS